MKFNGEVIIIGGGVIGLACAHYLADQGARVTVLERDRVGSGASHGNCGLLYFSDVIPLCVPGAVSHEIVRTLKGTSPLYIKPELDFKRWIWLLKFAGKCRVSHKTAAALDKYKLLAYSMSLFEELLQQKDMACDFETPGVLTVFKDPENFKGYQAKTDFLDIHGVGGQRIDPKDLGQTEPALLEGLAGGFLNEIDWHLRPDMLMASWKGVLTRKGVVFEEQTSVLGFDKGPSGIRGVRTDSGQFQADTFVLATGAWAPLMMGQLGLNLPVEPGKGYSITMARPGICPTHPCYLYENNMVVTPWKSGCRLGGTMEFSGYDTRLNRKRLKKLITGAQAFMKEPLGRPVIEEWTSFRPMTYDDMPIIDRVPGHENLIVATGHGMLGLTLATGTGKAVCDLLSGHPPAVNLAPFSLNRFN